MDMRADGWTGKSVHKIYQNYMITPAMNDLVGTGQVNDH